jgi:hypothetical protein
MTRRFVVASVCAALVAGSAMLAAPGQGTRAPGQATEGRVWIENRGRNEAIPVTTQDPLPVVVQNVTGGPIAVRLTGTSSVQPHAPIAVTSAQQRWEYRTILIPANVQTGDLTNLLVAPGNDGFEPAGVQLSTGSGTLLVLKRPR